jgi:hypothetical protein
MLIIGLGIGMIIAGIITLVRGRLQLSQRKAVQGVPAYILGVALLTPLPLGFLVAITYTILNVDPNKPEQLEQWTNDNEMVLNGIVAGVEIGLGLIIIVIAACLAKPLSDESQQVGRRTVDYDDELPRRRELPDGDEEDHRLRRRPFEDEGDYHHPRRGDDLDERAR